MQGSYLYMHEVYGWVPVLVIVESTLSTGIHLYSTASYDGKITCTSLLSLTLYSCVPWICRYLVYIFINILEKDQNVTEAPRFVDKSVA